MEQTKKFLKQNWLIIISTLAVLLVVIAGILYLTNRPMQKPEEAVIEEKEVKVWTAFGFNQIIDHNQRDDCWVVFDIEIYDISDWEYPGETNVTEACGKLDASKHFAKDNQEKPPADLQIGVWPRHGLQ